MSLSSKEQQALRSIGERLAGSDPELAAMLSAFTRLAAGEEMPAREMLRPVMLPGAGHRRPERMHAGQGRMKQRHRIPLLPGCLVATQVLLLLWILIAAALITVALIISHGSDQDSCAQSWPVGCAGSAPAPGRLQLSGSLDPASRAREHWGRRWVPPGQLRAD